MTERERLNQELREFEYWDESGECFAIEWEKIIDFIIEDRKRIVQPLIDYKYYGKDTLKAIDETLKNSGVE